jgi:hypothetical protein
MSNFLKNLAKRAAGVALTTECLPTPGPTFDRSLGSSETFQEVATEDSTSVGPQAEVRFADQSPLPTASPSPSGPDLHRSVLASSAPVSPPIDAEVAAQSSRPAVEKRETISSENAPSFVETTEVRAAAKTGTPDRVLEIRAQEPTLNQRDLPSVAESVAQPQPSPIENVLQVYPVEQRASHEVLPTEMLFKTTDQKPERARATKSDQVIRPVPDRGIQFQFPKAVPVTPTPANIPIHVRVGRVEVRGRTPEAPRPAPKERAAAGFAAYQRLRRYRI